MEGRVFIPYDERMFPPATPDITCVCDEVCVCGISDALIGPSQVAEDGSVELYWTHAKPSERLPDVIAEFGTPSIIDTSPGGMARWAPNVLKGTPFTEIILKDEEIFHGGGHVDFLTASVCVDLSPEVQQAMLPITESVWYDRLTHTLSARCHAMHANVATILLVTHLALRMVTPQEAPGLYPKMIQGSSDPKTYDRMKAEMSHNLHVIGCNK
jgi:hypothetical protein